MMDEESSGEDENIDTINLETFKVNKVFSDSPGNISTLDYVMKELDSLQTTKF